MNLGERLYQLRTNKGYSQDKLAELLDVSRQSISKWENNLAVPELDKLVKLSEIFGISLDMLIKGDEINHKNENKVVKVNQTQKNVAYALFGFSGLLLILGTLSAGPVGLLFGLIIAIPLIISGFIYLKCNKNAGLWCGWVFYIYCTSILLMMTGINTHTFINSLKHGLDLNVQSIVSFIQFIILILLIVYTVIKYSNTFDTKKTKKDLLISLFAFVITLIVDYVFHDSLFYKKLLWNPETRGWSISLINAVFDWTKTILFTYLCINSVKCIKNKDKMQFKKIKVKNEKKK